MIVAVKLYMTLWLNGEL